MAANNISVFKGLISIHIRRSSSETIPHYNSKLMHLNSKRKHNFSKKDIYFQIDGQLVTCWNIDVCIYK